MRTRELSKKQRAAIDTATDALVEVWDRLDELPYSEETERHKDPIHSAIVDLQEAFDKESAT